MKRYILHIMVAALFAESLWGQTTIPDGWKELPNPTSNTYRLSPGKYYLKEDLIITAGRRWDIGYTGNSSHKNKEYIINLNGHTIDARNVSKRSILNMYSGSLTIIDEPYDGSTPDGKIINSTATCVYVGPSSGYTATFNMFGGTIENCQPSNGEGGAVEVEQQTGETAIFNMYEGATITKCTAAQGAGVFVVGGEFNMYGGTITDNKIFSLTKDAANSDWSKPTGDELPTGINSYAEHKPDGNRVNSNYEYKGGGVYVKGGTFNMYDGEISENVSINGGGVYVVSNAKFNLKGGVIKNNYASSRGADFGNGGGIYIYGGSNCTIKKDTADLIIEGNRVSKYGGAIYVNGSTVTIEDCDIINNYASSGGGLAQEGTKCSMTLVNCNVSDNHSKNNTSINVDNEGSGAGVYIGNGGTSSTNKNTLTIHNSIIENNVSEVSGGGIFTGTNTIINVPANNVASILNNTASTNGGGINMLGGTFTVDGSMTLNGNTSSTGNGAGIFQGGGTFTVNSNATINVGNKEKPNYALYGNGGGIYCAGTFNVNGTANVAYNQASNGGGVCVQNGSVTLVAGKNSLITNNTATNYGGGLYVFNSGTTSQSATFNGGEFTHNTANAGGAVCADGNITLTLAADMQNNTANNGGAIYMQNGVKMSFGEGLIRNNQAVKKNDIGSNSANNLTAENNYGGIGGGVFMSTNSTLTFTVPTSFGIYNNKADNAAADIFANGNKTNITLPTTKGMKLNGYDVPGELYWAEDYVNGEVLANGNTGLRYQDALKDMIDPVILQFQETEQTKTLTNYSCLEIGYHLVLMKLICMGLEKGDDAGILISYTKNGIEKLYRKVLFTGTDGETVSKDIALPEYIWKFEASDWNNSKYKISFDPVGENNGNYTMKNLVYGLPGQTVTVNYILNNNTQQLTKFYNRVVNYMKPL